MSYYRKRYYRRNYVRRNNNPDLGEMLVSSIFGLGVILGTLLFILFKKIFSKRNEIKGLFKINESNQISKPTEVVVKNENVNLPEKQENEGRYYLKNSLLTETEDNFLNTLKQVVGDSYYVELQVQLSSIIKPIDSNSHFTNYADFNKIKAKSIDFVLFDKKYKPYLAIELDDRSHFKWKRMERDQFVNDLMKEVGLRIIRIPVSYYYDPEKLRSQIFLK